VFVYCIDFTINFLNFGLQGHFALPSPRPKASAARVFLAAIFSITRQRDIHLQCSNYRVLVKVESPVCASAPTHPRTPATTATRWCAHNVILVPCAAARRLYPLSLCIYPGKNCSPIVFLHLP
jgi:hypothetical protein